MKDYREMTKNAKHIFHNNYTTHLIDNANNTIVTEYNVFPGIKLIYNNIHIDHCNLITLPPGNYIEINHCYDGRLEREFKDGFFYLMPGDLSIERKNEFNTQSYFPLSHYHGITILIDIDNAPNSLSYFLNDINVSPAILAENFCSNDNYFISRSNQYIEHIFSELYVIPDSIKKGYFKVKVLELLLILSCYDPNENKKENKYLSRKQVSLAKDVCNYLISNIDKHITIAEAADTFHVSQTALKTAFKGVYGLPIYSYLRVHKMQFAALLLRQTDQSIMEIANKLGYDNASKFSQAFRDVMGLTPHEYRNTNKL